MTKIIDVHWHHVPKAVADGIKDGSIPVAGKVVTNDEGKTIVKLDNGFKQPLPPFLTDPATIIADLDAAGVDVACASIAPPLSHLDCDPQIALGVSRAINDAYAEVAEQHDGRIIPLANVPLQDVDLAIAGARAGGPRLRVQGRPGREQHRREEPRRRVALPVLGEGPRARPARVLARPVAARARSG